MEEKFANVNEQNQMKLDDLVQEITNLKR